VSRFPTIRVTADCARGTVCDDAQLPKPDLPLEDVCLGGEDAVWWELRIRAAYYSGLGYPVEIRVANTSPAWLLTQTRALRGCA